MINSSLKYTVKYILKNDYILNLFNKIYSIVIAILSSSFITRYLGVYLKGEYSYILQVVNVLVLILNFGFYQSYSYNYRKYGQEIFRKYICIFLFQFVIYILISIFLIIYFNNYLYTLILILVPFNVLKLQMENVMIVENIRLKIKINMFNITISMLMYGFMLFFGNRKLIYPILAIILIDLISIFIYLKKMNYIPKFKDIDISFLREILLFGYLPMLTNLLVTLNYSVDIFFLRNFGYPIELSLYSTAAGIVNYIWLIPDTFKDVLFSRVARKDSQDSVVLSVKLSLSAVIIVIFVFIIFGKLAIKILYGIEFIESYSVTIILFIGAISMIFFKIFGVVFLAEGKRWFFFISLFISVVLNVILNLLLIPLFDMLGAAIASVFSYSICGLLFLIYYSKTKNISINKIIILTFKDITYLKNLIKQYCVINEGRS